MVTFNSIWLFVIFNHYFLIIEEEEDLKKIRASNNTFLNNIDPSAYGPPESTKKRSYGYYQPQVTIVPPSSMVQEFLEKIENEEVMDQMNQTTK